ncbi:unnamed protein product [Ambrosiozyma monospora]|uniref:Unnamed protein product n=1 Tax=Ambrosiozyma monospora TaxID=43982 RepID=A0ACB5SVA5_AMBMO|nr:unnamed protein product [Ambrosiozyma monospora]
MEENGYRIVMKKNEDDAMICIRDILEEVHIPEEERLRAGLDQQFRKYLNEVRIRGTLGPVRVISIYVPSMMKEKKEFLQQLKRVLGTLEEEFIIGGDFNCVEDNKKDAEPKKTTGLTTSDRMSASRRAQLTAEEKLMREVVRTNQLTDVFNNKHRSQYKHIATNTTSHGNFDRRLEGTSITPLLAKANYSFDHLRKPAFTTHRIIELHISISNIETGRPIYTIRNNICGNKALSKYIADFHDPSETDINLKFDISCNTLINRAKATTSHAVQRLSDPSSEKEIYGNSATAILNLNETYEHLRKRAKTNRNSQLIAAINDPTEKKRKYTTPEIASVFTQYNKQVFQKQAQQQEAELMEFRKYVCWLMCLRDYFY